MQVAQSRNGWLHVAVEGAHIPLEVGRDGEVHFDDGAGDGLHAGRQLQARELVDQLVHRLA